MCFRSKADKTIMAAPRIRTQRKFMLYKTVFISADCTKANCREAQKRVTAPGWKSPVFAYWNLLMYGNREPKRLKNNIKMSKFKSFSNYTITSFNSQGLKEHSNTNDLASHCEICTFYENLVSSYASFFMCEERRVCSMHATAIYLRCAVQEHWRTIDKDNGLK